jgi:hypothetical protein
LSTPQSCANERFSPAPLRTVCGRRQINSTGVSNMGKYFLGWVMGVPVIVLVIVYLIFN